ncbi:dynein regulatory complex subunit 7 [Eucyclogobius newberryi]|uniref:dynein regulatory complex subunit 7 n=1 Tax=Eucyclogobius newberryi TaxID=166745 RepID=UPI003B5938EA
METEGQPEDQEDFMSCVDAQPQFPSSYTENTAEEEHLLYIAQSFQRHFSLLYPERRPLLLCPKNQCGVKKLVTTTLRPSLPGQVDLCTWQECSRFVSNYLTLQPLEQPTELPRSLRSPEAVLCSQQGTSLEYAVLLCSLLLGLNYNAYCVSGYASKHLCELDRSQECCPLQDSLLVLQDHGPAPVPDPLEGLRVHFWVLVLAGSRSVEQDFFIEPLSGSPSPTQHPHFLGVESVWNELNVYVNMQDCVSGCQELVWDPEDHTYWEPLVYGTTSRKQLHAEMLKTQGITKIGLQLDQDEEAGPGYSYDMPLSWCSMIHITDRDLEMCWPGGFKVTHFKKARMENFIPFFCPDGVVTRLTLYQDPEETQVEMLKEWFQNRVDLLMERENRAGFTTERFRPGRRRHLIFHRFNTSVPEACPAPSDPGVTPEREMCFGPYRVDGLVSRLERGNNMMETFEKRRDFLFQRHTVLGPPTESKHPRDSDRTDWAEARPIVKVVEQFHRDPSKAASEDIAERVFLLSERRIEVTYHLEENTFIAAKRIFNKPNESTKTEKAGDFTKDNVSTFQVNPQAETLKLPQLHQVLLMLIKEEQKSVSQIRSSQRTVQSLVQSRAEEQEDIRLETCPWTTTGTTEAQKHRERVMLLGEELSWLEHQQKDLLAPVLMRLNGTMDLSPDQARTVYQECLQDFRSRMVQHACLIQRRIEEDTRDVELSQEKDSEDLCAKQKRQIQVAQKRLQIHKECAPLKYRALEQQLTADPRLGPHLNHS